MHLEIQYATGYVMNLSFPKRWGKPFLWLGDKVDYEAINMFNENSSINDPDGHFCINIGVANALAIGDFSKQP